MENNVLFNQILSDTTEDINRFITAKASEWAIAGFIDEANTLLEKLWSCGFLYDGKNKYLEQGLQVFWNETKRFPKNIPFEFEKSETIEKDNWESVFSLYRWSSTYVYRLKKKSWKELSGNDLLVKAISLAYQPENINFRTEDENQNEALEAIERYLSASICHDSLNFVIILSAQKNLVDKALIYLESWAKTIKNKQSMFEGIYLMRDKAVVKLLLTKHLAKILEVSSEKCNKEILEITHLLDRRIKEGRLNIYGDLTWKEVLLEVSSIAISTESFDFKHKAIKQGWLGSAPCTTSQIFENENRLKTKLPKSYKDFLLETNGFSCFSFTGVTLLPIQKVDWLRNTIPMIIDVWANDTNIGLGDEFANAIRNALLIGGIDEEQQLLLIPNETDSDWECWFFASWIPGEVKYPNFRFYIEKELFRLKEEADSEND